MEDIVEEELESLCDKVKNSINQIFDYDTSIIANKYFADINNEDKVNELSNILKETNLNVHQVKGKSVYIFKEEVYINEINIITAGSYGIFGNITVIENKEKRHANINILGIPRIKVQMRAKGLVIDQQHNIEKISYLNIEKLIKTDGGHIVKRCEELIEKSTEFHNSGFKELRKLEKEKQQITEDLNNKKMLVVGLNRDYELKNKELISIKEEQISYHQQNIDLEVEIKELKNAIRVSKAEIEGSHEKLKKYREETNTERNKISELLEEKEQLKNEINEKEKKKNLLNWNMDGYSDETVKQIRLYSLLSILMIVFLFSIFSEMYSNAKSFIEYADNYDKEVSIINIISSRLPMLTVTALIIGGLTASIIYLIRQVVELNTNRILMVKASVLADRVNGSIDTSELSSKEVVETKINSKIELVMRLFERKERKKDDELIDILKSVLEINKK